MAAFSEDETVTRLCDEVEDASFVPARNPPPPPRLVISAEEHAAASWAWFESVGRPTQWVAPLVGYSEPAFRLLCRQYGAEMASTPMLDAGGLVHSAYYRSQHAPLCFSGDGGRAAWSARDRPLIVQLGGSEPSQLGEVGRYNGMADQDLIPSQRYQSHSSPLVCCARLRRSPRAPCTWTRSRRVGGVRRCATTPTASRVEGRALHRTHSDAARRRKGFASDPLRCLDRRTVAPRPRWRHVRRRTGLPFAFSLLRAAQHGMPAALRRAQEG